MEAIMTEAILNLAALAESTLNQSPFPYLIIPNIIHPQYLSTLAASFPAIEARGSIPASSVNTTPLWQRFITELEGQPLQHAVQDKFLTDLTNKPTMITLRGYTGERDGRIHTDSKDKLFTVLIYLNETWNADGGKLRLLTQGQSLDEYVAEVTPLAGTCIIFKVTDNCWHGHKPFIGKRLSLQLNYMAGKTALTKHLKHHRMSAWLKQLFPKLFGNQNDNY